MSLNNSDAELQKVSCVQEHAYVYARRWQASGVHLVEGGTMCNTVCSHGVRT